MSHFLCLLWACPEQAVPWGLQVPGCWGAAVLQSTAALLPAWRWGEALLGPVLMVGSVRGKALHLWCPCLHAFWKGRVLTLFKIPLRRWILRVPLYMCGIVFFFVIEWVFINALHILYIRQQPVACLSLGGVPACLVWQSFSRLSCGQPCWHTSVGSAESGPQSSTPFSWPLPPALLAAVGSLQGASPGAIGHTVLPDPLSQLAALELSVLTLRWLSPWSWGVGLGCHVAVLVCGCEPTCSTAFSPSQLCSAGPTFVQHRSNASGLHVFTMCWTLCPGLFLSLNTAIVIYFFSHALCPSHLVQQQEAKIALLAASVYNSDYSWITFCCIQQIR